MKLPKIVIRPEDIRTVILVLTLGFVASIFGLIVWDILDKGAQ